MNCADACLEEMKIYIEFLQGLNLRSFVDLVQCTSTDSAWQWRTPYTLKPEHCGRKEGHDRNVDLKSISSLSVELLSRVLT